MPSDYKPTDYPPWWMMERLIKAGDDATVAQLRHMTARIDELATWLVEHGYCTDCGQDPKCPSCGYDYYAYHGESYCYHCEGTVCARCEESDEA